MTNDEMRARFEAWYIENTPDYSLAPLGSRDCGLQWKAWQACHAEMQGEDVRRDTERLDFVLSTQAFLYMKEADSGAMTYQLWTQDENEVFHVLSGKSLFFSTPRKAIDTAMGERRG